MILQAAGVVPPDWESALESLVQRFIREGISGWWLTGSAALAARGIDVLPRDIDLVVTTGEDAERLGEALSDWLVEPVQHSHGWVARWFGRAFEDARIEWVGEVEDWVDRPEPTEFGPIAAASLQSIKWRDHTIMVPPIELQLAVSTRRGMTERAIKIRRAMA
jgi:hypothetical protein